MPASPCRRTAGRFRAWASISGTTTTTAVPISRSRRSPGETYPLFKNDNGTFFRDVTYASGLGAASIRLSGWGNALADFDNDGFKDLVTANSHANDRIEEFEAATYRQPNTSSGT